MTTFVFGTEHEPKKAIGESVKECIEKIKKFYIDREQAFIDYHKNALNEARELGEYGDSDYEWWIVKESLEEADTAILEITAAKTMAALELVLQNTYDENLKIVEEKFNIKK